MKHRHLLWAIAVAGCIDGQGSPINNNNDISTGGPTGGSIDTTPDSTSVVAACSAAPQPIHSYTQAAELEALLIGKWRHCSGPLLVGSSNIGIELVDDHTYFKLATDTTGALVRMVGFDAQGTWDTYQVTRTGVQFDLHPLPNSIASESPMFEDNPRRMGIQMDWPQDLSLYVLEAQ